MHAIKGKDDTGAERNIFGPSYVPGFPEAWISAQVTAASLTDLVGVAWAPGRRVYRARLLVAHAPAVGESMTVAVNKIVGGVTTPLLTGGVFNVTAAGEFELPIDETVWDVAAGGEIEVVRGYVAGGGPAMTRTLVQIDSWGDVTK